MSPAHPLAERLIEHLQRRPASRVLDFASGSGRNTTALREAGFTVFAIDDAAAVRPESLAASDGTFAAAVSTHGLLHGTPESIAAAIHAIAERLENEGRLYATFGSVRDARFGQGERIGDWTFAPTKEPERGVAHTFYDRERLEALLSPDFLIESLDEGGGDKVHWFVVARKR